MKPPLLNQLERRAIRETASLYAARLELHINLKHLKRELDRICAPIIEPVLNKIKKKLQ